MQFSKQEVRKFSISYVLGMAMTWVFYWFVGEDFTAAIFFATTCLLWVSTYRSMPQFQQSILKGACALRMVTGGATATRKPAMLIEALTLLITGVFFNTIGFSLIPIFFLTAQVIFINLLIERVIVEDQLAGLVRANLDA